MEWFSSRRSPAWLAAVACLVLCAMMSVLTTASMLYRGHGVDVSPSAGDLSLILWSEVSAVGSWIGLLLAVACPLAIRLRCELRARRRAEAEVSGSDVKFRLLADNASDLISRVDHNGDRDYVSPSAEHLLGVAPERLLGKALWDYIDPRDLEAVKSFKTTLDSALVPLSTCFRIRRIDGEQRWVEALARPVLDHTARAPGGYISAWRDVTDRKRAELQLAENEARYRALVENSSDVITLLDMSLRHTYVSAAAEIVLGLHPDELVGVSSLDIVHSEDRADAMACLSRLQSGASERVELTCQLKHKSGHYTWVEGKFALLRDHVSGLPGSIICSIRDISERRAQQETLVKANLSLERLSRHLEMARDTAEQANSAKSRFLANVSHELRTPLNGILGYTQLLQLEGDLNARQATRVDAMLGAGQHLLEMINGVLDISEIEAGHFELHPASTDLVAVCAACIDLVRPAAERKMLALGMDLADDLPQRVMLDATRFRQILLNLLGNAVKYTAAGLVRLRLRRIGHATLRLEISDTGRGIPADRRDRLFQDFERLGADSVLEVEGAGIGLALSRRLSTAMGGSIGHSDNPGGGSIFWFELPLKADETIQTSTAPSLALDAGASSPVSLRVLVVDDVAINRDVTASFLRMAGHQPSCATSGEEAVSIVAGSEFDLILMDVRMPGIGGLKATRQIRSLPGTAATIPIAALTAQAFAGEIAACRAAGMQAHLPKPFTRAALQGVLDQACTLNHQRRGAASAIEPAATDSAEASADGLPLIDLDAFHQTVEMLPPHKVVPHLNTLIERTKMLLHRLRPEAGSAELDGHLDATAAAAHSIAGSAGVFGFPYLAMVARNFEYAAKYQVSELAQMEASLIAAADASLLEMERCVTRCAVPSAA